MAALTTIRKTLVKDFIRNKYIYLMVLPAVVFYIVFHYGPMYGLIVAFHHFRPALGFLGSPWAGITHFLDFFSSYYFWRLVRNTFLLSFYDLLFGFPAPVVLALLLNEVRSQRFKKTVQTLTYLPYFISVVIIAGIIVDFTRRTGVINDFVELFGGRRVSFLLRPDYFRTIFVTSNIWQFAGWGSIIYLAALTNIDPDLYQAAMIDGAGRLKQVWHISIPGIAPVIVILLILQLGNLMTVGFEKVLLLYNPLTYVTADIIQTFVYRRGLLQFEFSYSAAVGLVNSLINFTLLVLANYGARRYSETSLW